MSTTERLSIVAPPLRPAVGPLRRLWRLMSERTMIALIHLCGISAIIFVLTIFYFIFREGAPFLLHGFDAGRFFGSADWAPTRPNDPGLGLAPSFGIVPMLAGTASVTLLAMLIAAPLGLAVAVYISEFCGRRTKETLKVAVELLAAIPSVVWGFIGLAIIGPVIIRVTGSPVGVNTLNAGIVVGLMSVPIIVSIAEDALRAVPDSYREAAEALGVTRWQMVYKVLLPAARSGLLAAVLLGVGRCVGETMAVLMCTGHSIKVPFDGTFPYFHPLESTTTLTATIASELGEAVYGGRHYQALFVIGVVLFSITFVINLIADLVVRGVRRKR